MIELSFSSKSLGKIHRRSTLEEFRLPLFVYRPFGECLIGFVHSPREVRGKTPFSCIA